MIGNNKDLLLLNVFVNMCAKSYEILIITSPTNLILDIYYKTKLVLLLVFFYFFLLKPFILNIFPINKISAILVSTFHPTIPVVSIVLVYLVEGRFRLLLFIIYFISVIDIVVMVTNYWCFIIYSLFGFRFFIYP